MFPPLYRPAGMKPIQVEYASRNLPAMFFTSLFMFSAIMFLSFLMFRGKIDHILEGAKQRTAKNGQC